MKRVAVLKKDGTTVEAFSWNDLEDLKRKGEIDDFSSVTADGFSGRVGNLNRSFFGGDGATVLIAVLAAVAGLLLVLLLFAALAKGAKNPDSWVARAAAPWRKNAESKRSAEDEEYVDADEVFPDYDAAAFPISDETAEETAQGNASASATGGVVPRPGDASSASDAGNDRELTESDRELLRVISGFKATADAERRIPSPLRRRAAYVGFEEREVGILLTPAFDKAYGEAIEKSPFSFLEFVSSERREANFNVWGGTFASNPYADGLRAAGPSPHILPNPTQAPDIFFNDVRQKREYVVAKKKAYVERKKAEKKAELEAKGETPKPEELEIEFPDDKVVVDTAPWKSVNELYLEMREVAALLDAGNLEAGRERLNAAQERTSYSAKVFREEPRVKAVFSTVYYYLKALEIKEALVDGDVAKAEAEFVNLTNAEFFKEQFIGFQLGVYKDFAGLLVKFERVRESIKYLEHCREYCWYVYNAQRATASERRAADVFSASLAWDLIYIYERLGEYEKVVQLGEPLWEARAAGRAAPARDALFNYDVDEMRKHLAIAYWNVGKKELAKEVFKGYLEDRKRMLERANARAFWGGSFEYKTNSWQDAAARARRMLEAGNARETTAATVDVDFEFAFCRAVARVKSALYWGEREKTRDALDETRALLNSGAAYQTHVAQTLNELAAALYAYGCWEDAEFCYRKTWTINAVCFNDATTPVNLDATLGIAASLTAQGRQAEATRLVDVGLDPILRKCVEARAEALRQRALGNRLFDAGGEAVTEAALRTKVETVEDLGGACALGCFGVWMRAAALETRQNIEEATRRNTLPHWLFDLANECRAQESWAAASLLYRRLEKLGGLPSETPSEAASFEATLKARIVECEAKLKEETI